MKIKQLFKRIGAASLSIAMFLSFAISASAADTPGLPGAGEEGYASLHQYVSPTNIKNVYKVRLVVSGFAETPPPTEVAIVIDNSSSMSIYNQNNDMEVSISQSRLVVPTPPHIPYREYTGKQTQWRPAMQAANSTRLKAAVQGAQAAATAFFDPQSNPGYDKTKMGVVAFSSPSDAISQWPYVMYNPVLPAGTNLENYATTLPILPALPAADKEAVATSYGYGSIQDSKGNVTMNNGAEITYSTRLDQTTNASNYFNLMQTLPAIVTPWAKPAIDELSKMGKRPIYAQNIADPLTGMIEYKKNLSPAVNAANIEVLKKDLADQIKNPVETSTFVQSGLEEASFMLFGDVVAGNHTAVKGDPRRFLILLTDGADQGFEEQTYDMVSKLKNAGVRFMVIGVDTEGGSNAASVQSEYLKSKSVGGHAHNLTALTLPDGGNHDIVGKNYTNVPFDKSAGGSDTPWLSEDYRAYLYWMALPLKMDPVTGSPVKPYNVTGYQDWTSDSINSSLSGGITPAVVQDYTDPAKWNKNLEPYYEYIDPADGAEGVTKAFNKFIKNIIEFGKDGKVDAKLNAAFNVYQYPGEPLFRATGGSIAPKDYSYGRSFTWDLNGGLPLTGTKELIFYVEIDEAKTEPGLYLSPLDEAILSVTGPFRVPGNEDGTNEVSITKSFKQAYATSAKAAAEEAEAEVAANETEVPKAVSVHKRSKDADRDSLTSHYVSNARPDITGVFSKKLSTGKTQVSVVVKNGSLMTYQWQNKDENGTWLDIFGANSSTYVLGSQFVIGKEYTLRCIIKNPAGEKTLSDSIKVKVEKATAKTIESLSTK